MIINKKMWSIWMVKSMANTNFKTHPLFLNL